MASEPLDDAARFPLMTGALYGLLGAALIGSSDACARWTAQRVSLGALFLAVMGFSTLALTAAAAALGLWPRWDLWGWFASAASGALNLVALGFLYRALARGPVSIASPAASTFAVMLAAGNALAGAPFGWTDAAAVLTVFLGVAMLSRTEAGDAGLYDAAHVRTTLLLALAAAAFVAVRFYLAQDAAEALGAFQALHLNRVFALLAALVWIALERRRGALRPPERGAWPVVALQAVLETAALGAFLIGSTVGDRVSAGIGFAAFPAFTVAAAALFLGDRIGLRRAFWVAVSVGGVMLAAA